MMQGLIKEGGFSLAEVGKLWGHSKSWVSRRLKLLTALDTSVKRALNEGDSQDPAWPRSWPGCPGATTKPEYWLWLNDTI